ncbi:hypothetical protein EVAR_45009_1 [Eumeta japonica]|uniref:Uncharacterized protein n=1 Tax=Eumeta variegata TaxID=151549 RepID=A0A4C1XG40_EUMVA|nr:hypothetical protein EVAR_45009_1 [Eumeta japonica]
MCFGGEDQWYSLKAAVITARPLIGVFGACGANAYANEVHDHASPIKMYATHMCNGCTTYKMQWEWCIRHKACTREEKQPEMRAYAVIAEIAVSHTKIK